mmetsp:Transcript_40046/g.83780  ORF Transcript_40046/g.83780 Transcript_40046/m.83780 type:complete len:148 (-) Transcript_40046:597-1040(-)
MEMDDRSMLQSTGRIVMTRIVDIDELENSMPLKFKARLSDRNISGDDGIAVLVAHATSSSTARSELHDLQTCLLMDFPKKAAHDRAPSEPSLFARAATHIKVTALIAHSHALDTRSFAKIAMGEIGRNIQVFLGCIEPSASRPRIGI